MSGDPELGVGVDVGGTKLLGVVLGAAGDGQEERAEIVCEERRETPGAGESLPDDVVSLVRSLLATAGAADSVEVAVGVGVPGLVDRDGVLHFSPNLPAAGGSPVRSRLSDLFGDGRPVYVDNDAACAAAGECTYGAGRGRDDVLFVTLGTGIGGGIVSGGRLLRGAGNLAGEIGHLVVDPAGPPCGCGRRGCWERYASGSGLGRLARDAVLAGSASRVLEIAGGDPGCVRGEHVVAAAAGGDAEAEAILAEHASWVALGLANLVNVLDPELIVIGGGLAGAGEAFFAPLRRALADQVEGSQVRPPIGLVPAELGDRAGAIGAAVLGRRAASSRARHG